MGQVVSRLQLVSRTVLAPVLVVLSNKVIAIRRTDPAQVAGTGHPGFLTFDVGAPLFFEHNTYHHIQHRYVYPFVLFLITIW
jgi:hypothetical protein